MNDKQIKNKEQIKLNQRMIDQAEIDLDRFTKKREIEKSMLKFQRDNCKIIDGKPEWLQSPKYMELTLDLGEINFEIRSVKELDEMAKDRAFVDGAKKEIKKLQRNHDIKEVKETKDKGVVKDE